MTQARRISTLILALALFVLLSACKGAAEKPPLGEEEASSEVEAPRDPAPKVGRVFVNRTYIQASYDDVWREFTTEAGYSRWYSAPVGTFEAKVGGKVAWGSKDSPLISGEITRITKGQGLSHSFQFAWIPDEVSPVIINILQQGEVVRVEIIHDCRKAPQTAEVISVWGWQKALARLKTLLEVGKAMPWPDDAPKSPKKISSGK